MHRRRYSGELTTPNDRNSYRFIKQITLKTKLGRREQWLVDYIVSGDKRNFRDHVTNNYYFTNDSNKTYMKTVVRELPEISDLRAI